MIVSPADSEVASHFSCCELVMWPTLSLTHIVALSRLPIHEVPLWKKLKSRDALEPISKISKHSLSVWTGDLQEALVIQKMLTQTENEIRALVRLWFPKAVLSVEMHSWRYMVTENEPLHFDVYAERVKSPVIRVFINLDTIPRIWDIGPTDDGSDSFYDPVYKARILKKPTKRIEFAPGSAWLVDSRRVAHAIIYGRRAAMFSFETRLDP